MLNRLFYLPFMLLCLLIGFSEQFVIYYVGLLPSEFYEVFGEEDWDAFKRHTVYSTILIVSIAFVSCFCTVHFEPVLIIHDCVLYIASSFSEQFAHSKQF